MAKQVKGTVEGYTLWALTEFERKTGKKSSKAVATALDRWAEKDADYLTTLGISSEEFAKTLAPPKVVSIDRKKR